MSVHQQVLSAAVMICRQREGWRFQPAEVVRVLPHLPAGTVRTHVTSRLCVNAPANHPHRWPYFRRLSRGLYEVLPAYRTEAEAGRSDLKPRKHLLLADAPRPARDTAHAVVARDLGAYVAECLEIPVVVQGRTLDEVIAALRAAIDRKLSVDSPAGFGLTRSPRLLVSMEFALPANSRR